MLELLILADHAGMVPQRLRLRDGYDLGRLAHFLDEVGCASRVVRCGALDVDPAADRRP